MKRESSIVTKPLELAKMPSNSESNLLIKEGEGS